MEKFFPATNQQKVLWLLIGRPRKKFLESEIQKKTNLSKAGVNFALKDLKRENLVLKQKIGKSFLYFVSANSLFIKQLKILKNISALSPLLKKLIPLSSKINLFGSAARGENDEESDFDLFILTNNKEAVVSVLSKSKRKLQPIIKNQIEWVELEKKDPIFFNEVERGITLYDEKFSV